MNLILCGFKNSGKTTLGRLLAEKLQINFFDVDQVIERRYLVETDEDLTFKEIYQKVGEKEFRRRELEAIKSLANVENSIIALGGGSLSNPDICYFLKKIGKMVFLNTPKELLLERVLKEETPGFLDKDNIKDSFEKLFRQRKEIYEKSADVEIATEGKSLEELVSVLEKLMDGHGK